MLKAPCKKCCAIRTLLLLFWYVCANISATWFNSREFTLFWREFPNVAKYAFFVLIFWAEIFIRAIFLRFCISVESEQDFLNRGILPSPPQSTSYVNIIRTNNLNCLNWSEPFLASKNHKYMKNTLIILILTKYHTFTINFITPPPSPLKIPPSANQHDPRQMMIMQIKRSRGFATISESHS